MHFEERLRYGIYRRTIAHARNARPQIFHADDVDAAERRSLAQRNVGGWKAEVVSKLRAVHDTTAERIGTSEESFGVSEIACLQRRTHRGARYALAVQRYVRHRLQRETIAFERSKIAFALA